jgi:protein-tyrosine-phosphatase
MSQPKVINVLFLCTHNSARSILAEGLLNHLGQGRFKGFSAGSHPQPQQKPNPYALKVLHNMGIDTSGLYSKNWEEFEKKSAPTMDLVITVCDNAAGEACPFWPGSPATAHWGYADPSRTTGSEENILNAFNQTLNLIKERINQLINLPESTLMNKTALQIAARNLGAQ